MATLDNHRITNNTIELEFGAFILFSKTVILNFIEDKDKIQKLINIATMALGKNNDSTLEFYYDSNNIEVSRKKLEDIIKEISKKIN